MDGRLNHMEDIATYTGAVRQAIQVAISDSGHTLTAVSEGTGISQSSLSRKLKGTAPFTVTEVDLIARHLGIQVEQLSAPCRAVA
jgi:lambda repressor-like predicted transcriptional regulator